VFVLLQIGDMPGQHDLIVFADGRDTEN